MGGVKGQTSKSKKASSSENNNKNVTTGKGKVTAIQVAFIVDRYLSDNNFLNTRSSFRNEASHLLSKLPVHKAPKSLLSLGDMLDEYICLKEQKVIVTQEKNRLDQDKFRVQKLLTGIQDVMNTYNLNQSNPITNSVPSLTPPTAAAVNFPVYNKTPPVMSTSRPSISLSSELTTPTTTTTQPTLKRKKNSRDVSGAPLASKRSCSQPSLNPSATTTRPITVPTTTSSNNQQTLLQITPLPSTSHLAAPVLGSSASVAKCLFNPGPQTPSPSPTGKSLDHQTPPSTYKKTVTPQKFTSTNHTVITSETIKVSPTKQVSYYSIKRNHCISSPIKTTTNSKRFTTRDHVKGRLDFDGASEMELVRSEMLTSDENSGSPSEDDVFDFELPNLDCLGSDFNLTDLLGDFDLDGDRLDYFCQPTDNNNGSTPESLSGSPDALVDGSPGDHQLLSGMSSTSTEIRSGQDMNMPGPNSVTSFKSITKCIKVFSPVRNRRTTGSYHEICDAEQVV